MVFFIFVVGLCQNIYLLLLIVCGGMVYGVREYFIAVGAFLVSHDISPWEVNGIDFHKK